MSKPRLLASIEQVGLPQSVSAPQLEATASAAASWAPEMLAQHSQAGRQGHNQAGPRASSRLPRDTLAQALAADAGLDWHRRRPAWAARRAAWAAAGARRAEGPPASAGRCAGAACLSSAQDTDQERLHHTPALFKHTCTAWVQLHNRTWPGPRSGDGEMWLTKPICKVGRGIAQRAVCCH